jgi:hypothetical protein
MGVDIGVCKYIPEREERIKRLEILERLSGDEGKKYELELQELFDNEITKENDELGEIPEVDLYLGQRMFNLWYGLQTKVIDVEFSFFKEFSEERVSPDKIRNIIFDIELLFPVADSEMKEIMEEQLVFYKYLVEHNLMIYPN